MNVSKYVDMYGNPIPRRCPTSNKILEDWHSTQKYCSEVSRKKARKERDEAKKRPKSKHKYPSPSEREIEKDNAEAMKPGNEYISYGKREAAKLAKAMGQIHAPAGFTSHEERQRRK